MTKLHGSFHAYYLKLVAIIAMALILSNGILSAPTKKHKNRASHGLPTKLTKPAVTSTSADTADAAVSNTSTTTANYHIKEKQEKCTLNKKISPLKSLVKRAVGLAPGSSRLWPENTVPIYIVRHGDDLDFHKLMDYIHSSPSSSSSFNVSEKKQSLKNFKIESLFSQHNIAKGHLEQISREFSKHVPGLKFEFIKYKFRPQWMHDPILIVGGLPHAKDGDDDNVNQSVDLSMANMTFNGDYLNDVICDSQNEEDHLNSIKNIVNINCKNWAASSFGHYSNYPNLLLLNPNFLSEQSSKVVRRTIMRQLAHILGMQKENLRYEATKLFTNYHIPRIPFRKMGGYDYLSITHDTLAEMLVNQVESSLSYYISETSTKSDDNNRLEKDQIDITDDDKKEQDAISTGVAEHYDLYENEESKNPLRSDNEQGLVKRGWFDKNRNPKIQEDLHCYACIESDEDDFLVIYKSPVDNVVHSDGEELDPDNVDDGEINSVIESADSFYDLYSRDQSPSSTPVSMSHTLPTTIEDLENQLGEQDNFDLLLPPAAMYHSTTDANGIPKVFLLPNENVSKAYPQIIESAYFMYFAMRYGMGVLIDEKKAHVVKSIGKLSRLSGLDIIYLNQLYPGEGQQPVPNEIVCGSPHRKFLELCMKDA